MNINGFDIDSTIRGDLESSRGVFRLFSNETDNIDSLTIKSKIFKYSPASFILNFDIFRELGKSATLINIERALATLIKANKNAKLVTSLTNLIRAHTFPDKAEITGTPPNLHKYPELLNATLHHFCSHLSQIQKLVMILDFGDKDFAHEFLDFVSPITDNLPDCTKIYFVTSRKKLKSDKFYFELNPDYYWDHPTRLGMDLQFLIQSESSALIDYITLSEISMLLRLWNLSDIAIPTIERAISLLPQYTPQELALLLNNNEIRSRIINQDRYHAEYNLYRELGYHLAKVGKTEKAFLLQRKATQIINNSSISKLEILRLQGSIWGESAQIAKQESNLADAIRDLKIQREIYEQINQKTVLSELSANAYNLGICYRELEDYREAIHQLNISINVAQELGRVESEIESRLELGRVYIDLEDNNSALIQFELIEKLLPVGFQGRALYVRGVTLAYMAYLYEHSGDMTSANNFAEKALGIFSQLGANEDIEKLRTIFKD